uniref:GPI mannosyltransferase 2 n=1 Tax=Heterorhabditis bacteriophora TaxID=37862 RepID=A0A1I7WI27_HETBA
MSDHMSHKLLYSKITCFLLIPMVLISISKCYYLLRYTVALIITSNKLHRGHISELSIVTHSVSASNCGSSLYNFLSSIQNSQNYYDNVNRHKRRNIITILYTFYFHALLGVTKVGSTKGHYYSINFGKNYDQRVYLFILLPIASLLILQVIGSGN